MLARVSRKEASCFLGSSPCSARAATIFDLVIGFAIESILLSPRGVGFFLKEGHSTWAPRPAVNMISHSIDGLYAIWARREDAHGDFESMGPRPLSTRFTRARSDLGGITGGPRKALRELRTPSRRGGPYPALPPRSARS